MTNAALVNRYLEHLQDNLHRSSGTVHRYRNKLQDFLTWVAQRPLSALTVADLNDYCGRVHPRSPVAAPATVAHDVAVLKSLFDFLHTEGVLATNPARRLVSPKIANDDPKPCPQELWLALWGSELPDDERVAFGLAYFCGLRRAEITALRVHQFVDVPAFSISGLKRKGGARKAFRWRSCLSLYEQRLPLLVVDPGLFLGALARVRTRRPDQALLSWRDVPKATFRKHEVPFGVVPPDMYNYRLERALARIGLPEHCITPHMLRHSFGTNMCQVGVDIQVVSRLMGHTNVNITMRYVDVGVDPLGKFLSTANEETEGLMEVSPYG